MIKNKTKLLVLVLMLASAFQLPRGKPEWASGNLMDLKYIFLPLIIRPASKPVFLETFDGDPPQPQPWNPPNWDVVVHSRDVSTWDQLEPMHAGHGGNCSPPPETHMITAYKDAVHLCKNHVMTAINASGYGVIYLTPDHMVDFSKGEAVIQFDVSTARTSTRDWIDLWITPYEDNLQLPLSDFYPDLSGDPFRAIQVEMGTFNGKTTFGLNVIRNFKAQSINGTTWIGYEDFLTPSATRRDRFELRISSNHIKFGMPDYNFWWFDADIPTLEWTQGIVQFGHHSYTPQKACDGCGPNTWHWDNVRIQPAIPFTIIEAKERYTNKKQGSRINLSAPAPADGYLRFSGIGKNLEVSFDDGATWQKALPQKQERYSEGAFWSYWMPIPASVSHILFRGQDWWGGEWRVKDISAWSRRTNTN
jgi:hypothetical protein